MARSRFKEFFDAVASGGDPSKADIEAEGFRPKDLSQVHNQVAAILNHKENGENNSARIAARGFAAGWQAEYDKDDSWTIESESTWPDTDDPVELAAAARPRRM